MQRRAGTSSSSHELPMEPRAYVEPLSEGSELWNMLQDQNNKGFLQDAPTQSCPERKNSVIWLLQITKFWVMVVQDLATQWLQSYSCKTKTSQETKKNLMKFLEPTRKPKVICTDDSLEFGKPCEEFSWIIVRQHHTDQKQMGLLGGQCAEWEKVRLRYCCNQVWMKIGGRIPWNAFPICETFKISCLMGRHHMKGGSECPVTDQTYRSEQWSNITLFLRKTNLDCISLEQKSCQVYFSAMHETRGESGKETLWSRTLKNWRRWTHQNSTPEGSLQRKC